MTSAALPPTPHAQAPDLAGRLGLILSGLRAVVAARFLRDPRLVLLTLPLWRYLKRAAARFTRLAGRIAAGRPASPRPATPRLTTPRPATPRPASSARPTQPDTRPHRPGLPSQKGWLLAALRHEAAVYREQLEHLLADPAMADLLAASPAAGRLLRPICRMLALPLPPPPQPARPSEPSARPSAHPSAHPLAHHAPVPPRTTPFPTSIHPRLALACIALKPG